jgi:hypothetical protein
MSIKSLRIYNGDKKEATIKHFHKRLFRRYHIKLTLEQIHSLSCKIKNNEVEIKHAYCLSNSRTVGILVICGKEIAVVYNKANHLLCTALPKYLINAITSKQYKKVKYSHLHIPTKKEEFFAPVWVEDKSKNTGLIKYKHENN